MKYNNSLGFADEISLYYFELWTVFNMLKEIDRTYLLLKPELVIVAWIVI